MKTLQDYQKLMPLEIIAKHNAMTADEAIEAAEALRDKEIECAYFGNYCSQRGPDGLLQMSNSLGNRADYFELLARTKKL